VDLYIVRHAAAFERDPDRWPDDSERPLSPEGEREFRLGARGLARIAPRMDAILSSPYLRAWQTAQILAGLDSSWPAPESSPVLEPTLPPEKAVAALEAYSGAGSVAVVGHRPGLHELAAYLLTGESDGLKVGIEKGGAVCVGFDGPVKLGVGELRWLLTPEFLRSLAAQHFR
jgi:phosphohistidine phosphatase